MILDHSFEAQTSFMYMEDLGAWKGWGSNCLFLFLLCLPFVVECPANCYLVVVPVVVRCFLGGLAISF